MSNRIHIYKDEQLRKLFIGGLSYETTDKSLKEYFSHWGEVVDNVVIKEKDTKKSKGFGFVTFRTEEEADDCMNNRPHKLQNRNIDVRRAVPKQEMDEPFAKISKRKAFIGGLLGGTTEEDLRRIFEEWGEVESVEVLKNKVTGKCRGFGFVTFKDADIVDKLSIKKFIKVKGRTCEVKKAISKLEMEKLNEEAEMKSRKNASFGDDSGFGDSLGHDVDRCRSRSLNERGGPCHGYDNCYDSVHGYRDQGYGYRSYRSRGCFGDEDWHDRPPVFGVQSHRFDRYRVRRSFGDGTRYDADEFVSHGEYGGNNYGGFQGRWFGGDDYHERFCNRRQDYRENAHDMYRDRWRVSGSSMSDDNFAGHGQGFSGNVCDENEGRRYGNGGCGSSGAQVTGLPEPTLLHKTKVDDHDESHGPAPQTSECDPIRTCTNGQHPKVETEVKLGDLYRYFRGHETKVACTTEPKVETGVDGFGQLHAGDGIRQSRSSFYSNSVKLQPVVFGFELGHTGDKALETGSNCTLEAKVKIKTEPGVSSSIYGPIKSEFIRQRSIGPYGTVFCTDME